MRGIRRRVPGPAPAPELATAHERGSVQDLAALLALLSFGRFAMPRGHWCYVLIQADGRPFWVGISGSLLGRLADHAKHYGNRIATVRVLHCRTEHEARVIQLMLIDRFEEHLANTLGTAKYEEFREAATRAAKFLDSPAHVTMAWAADSTEDHHVAS